jgi:hypothetical protein
MTTNTAPFSVQPRLTQIAMAVKPEGFIADVICPRYPVPGEKFIYTRMGVSEAFTIPDTKVGRTSEPNQVEFGGTDVTDSTEDHGLDDPVPNKDIRSAEGTNYKPLEAAAERTALLVELAREQRVSNLYFALNTYSSSLRTTLSSTGQWSDFTNSDPVGAILEMFDSMLVRPNVGGMGRAVWTKFRRHPKVLAAILNMPGGSGAGGVAAAGVASRKAVADLLELDDLIIGESFYNTAKKGQTSAYSRLWGKHAGFWRIEKGVRDPRGGMPTFGFTAQWGERVAGTIALPTRGLEGSQLVRVGEHVKELVAFQDAGCFFQNAVA